MFGLLVGWGPAPPSPRAVGQAGGEAAAKHACARQIPAQGSSKHWLSRHLSDCADYWII